LDFIPARLPGIDKAWLTFFLVLGLLAIIEPAQAASSIQFTWQALIHVLPFLLASIGIAAYVKATGADNLMAAAFRGRTLSMIFLAAAGGAVSPFCSCGVIPLIAALLSIGVPLAPVMAFWLASPLMDPSMFILTSGTLGMEFAVAKTLAAFSIGLSGGIGTWLLQQTGLFAHPLREGIGDGGCGGAKIRDPKQVVWRFWSESERRTAFVMGGWDNLKFLGKWLSLAFLLESLMITYIPASLVVQAVGTGDWLSIVLATLVGIPAYLNGYAALPLVAGLIQQGMAPGAGMAFLLAGGVTSIPAAIAVYALARPPVFVAYLLFALVGAVTAGSLFALV
jgi:uncharacterized membrane protein YraQ (UPF0718 family)